MSDHDSDTIRILITSDNHVGYNESDDIRGQDATETFREIMMLAKEHEVDMVLQGGDLFHVNKPSRKSMYEVIKILRQTCLGDKPCEMEVLNHGMLDYDTRFNHVNYEDPNINVAIPVFSISGNHDDSGGVSMLSPMDVLSATGLINHFGRVPDNDNITVCPILLRKGSTKLALYGIANVRDERLHRTFRNGNVKFLRPDESSDEWFNLLAVHQNHHAHSATNYLPEVFLPVFLDTVIWGHEHECLIEPVTNSRQAFSVIQPGSSVATSLCEGEAVRKHVGILSIKGKKATMKKILLKTVRPFIMETVYLSTDSFIDPDPDSKGDVTRWLIDKVESLIRDAHDDWKKINGKDKEPPLPLIRLKVDYSGGYEIENPTRFSNRFVGRVANVKDVIQYFRKKTVNTKENNKKATVTESMVANGNLGAKAADISVLITEFLKTQNLDFLPERGLESAVMSFVNKDEKDALKSFVNDSLEIQIRRMMELGIDDKNKLLEVMLKEKERVLELVAARSLGRSNKAEAVPVPAKGQDRKKANADESESPKPRGGRKTRGTTAKSGTARRGKKVEESESDSDEIMGDANINDDDDEDDVIELDSGDDEPVKKTTSGRGASRGRGKSTTARASSSRASSSTRGGTKRGAASTSRAKAASSRQTTRPAATKPKRAVTVVEDEDDGFD